MGYAFISYSSKNQGAADAFRSILKKNSVGVWMAPYDIPAGSEYAEVLYDALTGCSCLLLLLTGYSQNSQWVKKEVNIAISNNKTVVPVKLENIELNSAMKLYLNDQQIVPVYTLDESSDGVRSVLRSIIAITGVTNAQTTSNAPKVEKTRIIFDDGVYEGDLIDGKCTGKGKYTWKNGDVYEGDFVAGKRTGKGKFVSAFEIYEGDFVDGKYHGKGKRTFIDGSFYEGDFVDGKYNGYGKRVIIGCPVQQGFFKDGKFMG